MSKARNIADLLDANGDVALSNLDNVPPADLVNDTSPQLGGNLDINSNNITGTGNIDVTGTVTADGLTVDGDVSIRTDTNAQPVYITRTGNTSESLAIGIDDHYALFTSTQDENYGRFLFQNKHGGTTKPVLLIDSDGDISFYEDTGTTRKFFWDASSERLGIGTSSPAQQLHVHGGTGNGKGYITSNDSGTSAELFVGYWNESSTYQGLSISRTYGSADITYNVTQAGGQHLFKINSTEAMRIDSAGRVTMPYQPVAYITALTASPGADMTGGTTRTSRGGMSWNNSNGRLTVPVSGVYHIEAKGFTNATSGKLMLQLSRNGALIPNSEGFASPSGWSYDTAYVSADYYLSANDYIQVFVNSQSNSIYSGGGGNQLSAYLIG